MGGLFSSTTRFFLFLICLPSRTPTYLFSLSRKNQTSPSEDFICFTVITPPQRCPIPRNKDLESWFICYSIQLKILILSRSLSVLSIHYRWLVICSLENNALCLSSHQIPFSTFLRPGVFSLPCFLRRGEPLGKSFPPVVKFRFFLSKRSRSSTFEFGVQLAPPVQPKSHYTTDVFLPHLSSPIFPPPFVWIQSFFHHSWCNLDIAFLG